jgi:hypothetical protein
VSEAPPPAVPPREKLAVERQIGPPSVAKNGALFLYGGLTIALLGLALYMALIEGQPLISVHVAAPAIGALWFGLRLFMTWGSHARG